MWRYLNKNPLARDTNDCVIRSISCAESRSWDDVYMELSKLAQEQGIILDDVNFVEPYLDSKYSRICYNNEDSTMTVEDFIKTNPQGTFLVTMRGHITCVKDGVLYDTFDCRNRKIWCAWEVARS